MAIKFVPYAALSSATKGGTQLKTPPWKRTLPHSLGQRKDGILCFVGVGVAVVWSCERRPALPPAPARPAAWPGPAD